MADWDPDDPFVLDAGGFVLGLRCAPPHHADLLAAGWEGGANLVPLVAETPEAFTADLLVYRRLDGSSHRTLILRLTEAPPYVYEVEQSSHLRAHSRDDQIIASRRGRGLVHSCRDTSDNPPASRTATSSTPAT